MRARLCSNSGALRDIVDISFDYLAVACEGEFGGVDDEGKKERLTLQSYLCERMGYFTQRDEDFVGDDDDKDDDEREGQDDFFLDLEFLVNERRQLNYHGLADRARIAPIPVVNQNISNKRSTGEETSHHVLRLLNDLSKDDRGRDNLFCEEHVATLAAMCFSRNAVTADVARETLRNVVEDLKKNKSTLWKSSAHRLVETRSANFTDANIHLGQTSN